MASTTEPSGLLVEAFAACELECQPLEDFPDVLETIITGSEWRWCLFAQPEPDVHGVFVYSVFPVRISDERRLAVAELSTRLNYLLRYGNLEMDFTDGELRLRTSARGGPEQLPLAAVAELIAANVQACEMAFPAVEAVSEEGADPAEAVIAVIERLAEDS